MWKSPATIVAVALVVLCQQMHLVVSFSTCTPKDRNRGGKSRMRFDTMTTTMTTFLTAHDDDSNHVEMGRYRFLELSGVLTIAATVFAVAPTKSLALSSSSSTTYSSNARNLERLSSGDLSGGSTYDNYPKTEASKKRRALMGCKIPSARRAAAAAAQVIGEPNVLNEKDCNMRVMGGETEFMLETIRKLDCPTCPYGIDPK